MKSSPKRIIKIIVIILLLVLFGTYLAFQSRTFRSGPTLDISTPLYTNTTEKLFTLSGKAENISRLFLNNRQIFTNHEGFFKEELLLLSGYNIIEIKAQDAFERVVRTERFVFLNETPLSPQIRPVVDENATTTIDTLLE
jgi:hypothetical protein